jgi:hypothetical protein
MTRVPGILGIGGRKSVEIETFQTGPSINLRENISTGNSSILKDKKLRTTIKVSKHSIYMRSKACSLCLTGNTLKTSEICQRMNPQLVFIYIDRNPAKELPFNIGDSSAIICEILDLLSYTRVTETLWW